MRKLTERDIDKEAKRIEEEYAYMDDIPLHGWLWEFHRRSPNYIKSYEEWKKVCSEEDRNGTKGTFKALRMPDKLLAAIYTPGKMDRLLPPNEDHWLARYLPEPDVKYCDFPGNNTPLFGTSFIETTEVNDLKGKVTPVREGYALRIITQVLDNYEDNPRQMEDAVRSLLDEFLYCALETMAPTFPENTLFVGVSRTGKKDEIKKQLRSIVNNKVSSIKTKNRPEKWKYYLVTYDLKKREYSDSVISEILSKAFPGFKSLFDERNINNYWNQALALIDGKGYQKFLKYKFSEK